MRLKQLIEQTNTVQLNLCKIIGVAPSTMSQYVNEQREPPINILVKLADYFGVSVDYLIGHDSPPGDASPAVRNFVYINDKKYDLNENALKLQINGVNVHLSLEDAD